MAGSVFTYGRSTCLGVSAEAPAQRDFDPRLRVVIILITTPHMFFINVGNNNLLGLLQKRKSTGYHLIILGKSCFRRIQKLSIYL